MKKEKFFWEILGSLLIVFYGSFLTLAQLFSLEDLSFLITIFFALYGAVHLLISLYYFKEKQFSHLLLGIIGVVFFWIFYFGNILSSLKSLSSSLFAFAFLSSLVKLGRADYFHDRKSMIWRIEISLLLFFMLTVVLVSLNLKNSQEVVVLLFGFLSYLTGLFEFFEALILNLVKEKLK